ncbi:hypothetical protein JAAARDRAFT_59617 [Jaapia argillacea MUCL 33604]|uniref:Conserved oligomeric Golgi complex subunit 3 n=1 Tax=Jaapia argillacea MUCL 33604 TaxID=933084 RepID=A0A067PZ37_9AGAM|nr:hypothetical protein JAAARDRAFT_59617 [Jaapia argillacea MUCL 33604]
MASSTRVGPVPRRVGIPPSMSPHPKPVISVEEWESKAPLDDLQLRSVNIIKLAGERAPLPLKFSVDEESSSRPSTPTLRNKFLTGPSSRPPTPVLGTSTSRSQPTAHALLPSHPIQTPQQFYDWFALIDRSVAHSQESHFRNHLATVSGHLETCDALLERIDEIDKEVADMVGEWRSVEEGGRNLKDACERLLGERDKLLELTDAIGARLEYFQELEHATRMLNHPGESLVLQTDFLYMVERVDICIEFLRDHRHFKESELYLLRFQQCMTRAMTLIRMYFVGSLRALTADITKRLSEKDVSSTAQHHLLYTRFNSVSPQLSPLLGELERRARAHPAELSALLAECHTAYFGARRGLLVPRLVEEIRGLDPGRTELVELTRAGCSYLKQLCTDEFNLYRSFFNSGEEQLYQYLENLCDYLYDDLRPRILHEPRLTVLCEVCTVLQALMVLDVPTSSPSSSSSSPTDDEDEDYLTMDLRKGQRERGLGRLHLSHLLEMVLQDAQTRLFFKAQSVIQAEIRYYVVKDEDLAYPDKLVAAKKPSTGAEIKEKESVSQLFNQMSSLDKQETWFPTLKKTVWVLAQLHDFVNPAIFEDIAQEAISLCRQSLVTASELIKVRKASSSSGTGNLDGGLFLVRHLLILKEVTHSLDLVEKELVEYGGVTDTLASMLNRTTSLLPDALFASLGMPRSDETITDARQGIDQELKKACEEIIVSCSESICEPLRNWVDRLRALSSRRPPLPTTSPPTTSDPVNPQQSALEVEPLAENFQLCCHRDLRANVARLRLYVEDEKAVGVLVGHIIERIEDAYEEFGELVKGRFGGELRGKVMAQEELRVMLREICEEKGI